MNNIKVLIKNEILNEKRNFNNGITKQIIEKIILVFVMMAASFLFVSLFYYLGQEQQVNHYISSCFFIVEIIVFIYAISLIIRKVYLCLDQELLLHLPIKQSDIYLSKLLVSLLKVYTKAAIITLSLCMTFGVYFSLNVWFYIFSLLAILLLPLPAIGLAALLASPIMFAINFLKQYPKISVIIMLLALLGGFYLYSKVVFDIADIILLKKNSENILIKFAILFGQKCFFNKCLVNVLLLKNFFINLLLVVVCFVAMAILGVMVGYFTFGFFLTGETKRKNHAMIVKPNAKVVARTPFKAYVLLELKETLRSFDHLFTYFGMALAMPLMAWICNSFIMDFAIEKLGHQIIFGTTLFVVLVFVSIICSPSATLISKEGESFWILKTSPAGITTPLFAKVFLEVSSCAVAITATVIMALVMGYITALQGLFIALIALLYMLGVVFLGLFINLVRPNIFSKNYQNNSNMLLLLAITFVISICIGIFSIIYCLIDTIAFVILIASIISIVFAIGAFVLLKTTYKKLYEKMEV